MGKGLSLVRYALSVSVLLLGGCMGQSVDSYGTDSDIEVRNITPQVIQELANPPKALSSKTPVRAAAYNYTFGPGDIIGYKLWEGAEDDATNPVTALATSLHIKVESDGHAEFPHVGRVLVTGKTMEQLRKIVFNGLKRQFRNPNFDLQVLEFRSRKVTVSGAVLKPGAQFLTFEQLTLRRAIELAGGVSPGGDVEHTEIIHRDGTREVIDALALLNREGAAQDPILVAEDTVLIPDNRLNKIFVMGEVSKQSAQFIGPARLSLTEALNEAGGVNVITSSNSGIYVIRNAISPEALAANDPTIDESGNAKGHPDRIVYRLNVNNPTNYALADRFMLRPRDIVFVSAAPITNWNRFISQLIPNSFAFNRQLGQ